MKKLLLSMVLCFALNQAHAQSLHIDSVFSLGNSGWETISDMAITADGTYYVCGSFSGTIELGSHSATSNGKRDIFLAKIDENNTVQWLKNYGGLGDDNAYSLLFHNNNLYLSGSFKNEINLGTGNLLTAEKFTDVFIARLNDEGLVLKASPLKSESAAQKAILLKNAAGEIFIAGTYAKAININGTILNSNGKSDIYYAKYNTQDNLEAPISFGGPGEEQLYDFQISASDDFYFAGSFEESFTSGSNVLTANDKSDAFLIRMDAAGQTTLAQSFGGPYNDKLKCIALDAQDNIYLAGEFEHEISIGSTDFTAQRKHDVFLASLAADGTIAWDTIFGGNSYNTVSTLNIAANNKFYLSGSFRGEQDTLKSARNSKDAFIARYQSNGQREWLLQAGQNNEDNLSVQVNPGGELFVSGYFSQDFLFQGFEIKNQNFNDLIFGKLVDCETMPGISLGDDQTACGILELEVDNIYANYLWSTTQTGNSITISQSDTYWLQVTDKYSCKSTDTIDVIIENSLPVDLGRDTTLCEGQNLQLDAGLGFDTYLWDDNSTGTQRTIDIEGTYWVKVSLGDACGMDSIEVAVNPNPEFELGEAIVLTASDILFLDPELNDPAYTYLWSNGATTSTLTLPMSLFSSPAAISLTVTDNAGCAYYDEVFVQQGNPPAQAAITTKTEQEQLNPAIEYKIYPNPTSGKFFIAVSNPELVKQLDIFDIQGNHIKTFKKGLSFPLSLDLSHQPKGVYIIKMSNEKTAREFRVVLK